MAYQPEIALSRTAEASLDQLFTQAREIDLSHNGQAEVVVFVEIADSRQLSRVAETLERIDVAVRRATGVFYQRFDARGYALPTAAVSSGLILEAVEIGSYRARHRLQGQSLEVANLRPAAFALLSNLMAGAVLIYAAPYLPLVPKVDTPTPAVTPPPTDSTEIQIQTPSGIVTDLSVPPTALQHGVTATLTIDISGPGGHQQFRAEVKPHPKHPHAVLGDPKPTTP